MRRIVKATDGKPPPVTAGGDPRSIELPTVHGQTLASQSLVRVGRCDFLFVATVAKVTRMPATWCGPPSHMARASRPESLQAPLPIRAGPCLPAWHHYAQSACVARPFLECMNACANGECMSLDPECLQVVLTGRIEALREAVTQVRRS